MDTTRRGSQADQPSHCGDAALMGIGVVEGRSYHVDGLWKVPLASVNVSGNRLAEIEPCRIGL
jgi:hypothetical protein